MKELPPGYTIEGKPRHSSSEDCMGNPYSQWRQVATTPHDTCKLILAHGESASETTDKLIALCWEDHNFRSMPDQERLEQLVKNATKQGRFYDAQLIDVITILAKRK